MNRESGGSLWRRLTPERERFRLLLALILFVWGTADAFAPPAVHWADRCPASSVARGGVCVVAGESKRVCVVGAGAAGLATAKELRGKGHDVKVIDQASEVGGVWYYADEVEDDPLGITSQKHVHSSMYKSLRTNLPREVMSFSDFPFGPEFSELRYPSHTVVQDYLLAYTDKHALRPFVSFNRKVTKIQPADGGAWSITHCASGSPGSCELELFDAVAVCNGHYSATYIPEIPGIEHFQGSSSHSHNYRVPDRFVGKKVVVVGASNSGEDIAQEVATVAEIVVMCASNYLWPEWGMAGSPPMGPKGNIFRWPRIATVREGGAIELEGGTLVDGVDHIIFCTGYRYAFPFLDRGREVAVDENMITPLYKHVFPVSHPTMAFIGLPAKIVPFPQFELQARWAAMVWCGELQLPTGEEMQREVDVEVRAKMSAGIPQKYFHVQGGGQFGYNDELSRVTGSEPLPSWRRLMYEESSRHKRDRPWDYRDTPLPSQAFFEQAASKMAMARR